MFPAICRHFSDLGYKVGMNEPYSNSFSPQSDHKYKSVMIEVNKGTYIGKDGKVDESFCKMNEIVKELYVKLLDL